jgi:hypothetical protein
MNMNHPNDYLVVKAHLDDLVRAAERSRMADGARRSKPSRRGRRLARRLRHLIGRCPDLTAPQVHADCP